MIDYIDQLYYYSDHRICSMLTLNKTVETLNYYPWNGYVITYYRIFIWVLFLSLFAKEYLLTYNFVFHCYSSTGDDWMGGRRRGGLHNGGDFLHIRGGDAGSGVHQRVRKR